MKKSCIIAMSVALLSSMATSKADAQSKTYVNEENQKVEVFYPKSFTVSRPLSEILKHEVKQGTEKKDAPRNFENRRSIASQPTEPTDDPVWQKSQGLSAAGDVIANFDGLTSSYGVSDPTGAANSEYYVQAINTEMAIFDLSGNIVVSGTNLSSLWPGSTDDGDPIVLYDKHADRWFISQFQYDQTNELMVAISVTNDPTGNYYTYRFTMNELPDYPKYAIWWDGYYFSINSFEGTSGVLNRAKMLAGDPSAEMIVVTAPGYASMGFTSLLPADADGDLPANGSAAYFFNLRDDSWGQGSDAILVYKMVTDFTTPSNTTITLDATLTPSPFDADYGASSLLLEHISQKGTSSKIDAIPGVFTFRAQHRVWTGYNSVVLCHVSDLQSNDGRAGVRWYELRQTAANGWSIYQEGTFAPTTDTDNRWMGSIAMDDYGNIGLAYCVAGPDTYNTLRFTGRKATDALGQMTFQEVTPVPGAAAQIGNDRYGDYTHMSLAPDGVTFWFTGEYMAGNSDKRTRIFSFKLAPGANIEENPYYHNLKMQAFVQNQLIVLNASGIYGRDEISVDLFDITGKLLQHKTVVPVDNKLSQTFNVLGIPAGTYMVRIGNVNFQKVQKVALVK